MSKTQQARERAEWEFTPDDRPDAHHPTNVTVRKRTMSQMKNYLLMVLENCSEEQFGQDAVEWAIVSGLVHLTYNLQADLRLIMGEPGKPETGQYDAICAGYQKAYREQQDALVQGYRPLLEELNRSQPLAV
jgi:hypothetical protein